MEDVQVETSKVKNAAAEKESVKTRKTRKLLVKTLKKMGCQPVIETENENSVSFFFQGEKMTVYVYDYWLVIWDYFLIAVNLDDIEDFSRLRKAVNIANADCFVTVMYYVNKEDGLAHVNAKTSLMFTSDFPDYEKYLFLQLRSFFPAQRVIELELDRMRRNDGALSK